MLVTFLEGWWSVQIVCFGGGMRSNECPYSLQWNYLTSWGKKLIFFWVEWLGCRVFLRWHVLLVLRIYITYTYLYYDLCLCCMNAYRHAYTYNCSNGRFGCIHYENRPNTHRRTSCHQYERVILYIVYTWGIKSVMLMQQQLASFRWTRRTMWTIEN